MKLVNVFNEGGWFEVGDYFGCVHFEQKEELNQ